VSTILKATLVFPGTPDMFFGVSVLRSANFHRTFLLPGHGGTDRQRDSGAKSNESRSDGGAALGIACGPAVAKYRSCSPYSFRIYS